MGKCVVASTLKNLGKGKTCIAVKVYSFQSMSSYLVPSM